MWRKVVSDKATVPGVQFSVGGNPLFGEFYRLTRLTGPTGIPVIFNQRLYNWLSTYPGLSVFLSLWLLFNSITQGVNPKRYNDPVGRFTDAIFSDPNLFSALKHLCPRRIRTNDLIPVKRFPSYHSPFLGTRCIALSGAPRIPW